MNEYESGLKEDEAEGERERGREKERFRPEKLQRGSEKRSVK